MAVTGRFLRILRERRGLSKWRIEREAGVPHAVLFRLENGTGLCAPATERKLTAFFGLSETVLPSLIALDRATRKLERTNGRAA